MFDLAVNDLSGSISPSLSAMPHLELIFLDNNKFTGKFPQLSLAENLYHLVLKSNSFSGILFDCISNLTNIEEIDVGYNYFNGTIPNSISGKHEKIRHAS